LHGDTIAIGGLPIEVRDHQGILSKNLTAQSHLVEFLPKYQQAFPVLFGCLNHADHTSIRLKSNQLV
jgi:hypothetical protein